MVSRVVSTDFVPSCKQPNIGREAMNPTMRHLIPLFMPGLVENKTAGVWKAIHRLFASTPTIDN
jgi:hypothetical protein